MSKEKIVRLSWVDAARGLAAFGVALMHMVERMRSDYPLEFSIREGGLLGNLILDFFNLGKIGVVVFFFISGYVIPFSLDKRSLKEFVISRFFRLYPAYWISIILAIIIIGGYSLSNVLINVTMFQRFFGIPDMVGVYWTLQIELVFYFLCIVLFCFNRLFDTKSLTNGFYLFMAVSVTLAIVRFITDIKLPVALPLSLSVMFLGMVLRDAEESGRRINLIKYFGIFVLSLLLVCLFAYNRDYGYNEKWYKYFISYNTGVIIFMVFRHWNIYNKALIFLGKISYSLYLLHPVVGLGGTEILKENYFPGMGPLSYTLIFLSLSVATSTVSYYLVEKPAVKVGKNLFKKPSNVVLSTEK